MAAIIARKAAKKEVEDIGFVYREVPRCAPALDDLCTFIGFRFF
jgi:hypothetical protein